jgi:PAS domain S-box-containing protein
MIGKKTASEYSLKTADHIGAMLAYWDRDQICQFINSASQEWLGKSPKEIIGTTLKEQLNSHYPIHVPRIHSVLKGKSQTFETAIEFPSGEVRHAIVSYYPEKGKNVKGFFTHFVDVTLMKDLQTKFNRSASRYKKILDNTPDAMVIVSESGKIKLINAQCESIFGYSKRDLIGKSIEPLIPERFRHKYAEARYVFVEDPQASVLGERKELFAQRKNGEEFPVEIRLNPFKIKDELLVSISIRDVTWKVDKQKELSQSMDAINRQNKRLMNFAHIVSHNLKTHSTNLASVLALLNNAGTEDEKKQMMEFLQSVSAGFSETISNMNDIINIQTENNLDISSLNLSQYIQKCLDALDINVQSSGATIINRIDDQLMVMHNPVYLESIIQNFLTNAMKYRDAERPLVIKLDAYNKKNGVVLRIEDNGLGINLKKHGEKLFGIYQTFHGNADAKGIGLFITKYQVEELGGHITVMSNEGIGSVFTIYFRNK